MQETSNLMVESMNRTSAVVEGNEKLINLLQISLNESNRSVLSNKESTPGGREDRKALDQALNMSQTINQLISHVFETSRKVDGLITDITALNTTVKVGHTSQNMFLSRYINESLNNIQLIVRNTAMRSNLEIWKLNNSLVSFMDANHAQNEKILQAGMVSMNHFNTSVQLLSAFNHHLRHDFISINETTHASLNRLQDDVANIDVISKQSYNNLAVSIATLGDNISDTQNITAFIVNNVKTLTTSIQSSQQIQNLTYVKVAKLHESTQSSFQSLQQRILQEQDFSLIFMNKTLRNMASKMDNIIIPMTRNSFFELQHFLRSVNETTSASFEESNKKITDLASSAMSSFEKLKTSLESINNTASDSHNTSHMLADNLVKLESSMQTSNRLYNITNSYVKNFTESVHLSYDSLREHVTHVGTSSMDSINNVIHDTQHINETANEILSSNHQLDMQIKFVSTIFQDSITKMFLKLTLLNESVTGLQNTEKDVASNFNELNVTVYDSFSSTRKLSSDVSDLQVSLHQLNKSLNHTLDTSSSTSISLIRQLDVKVMRTFMLLNESILNTIDHGEF